MEGGPQSHPHLHFVVQHSSSSQHHHMSAIDDVDVVGIVGRIESLPLDVLKSIVSLLSPEDSWYAMLTNRTFLTAVTETKNVSTVSNVSNVSNVSKTISPGQHRSIMTSMIKRGYFEGIKSKHNTAIASASKPHPQDFPSDVVLRSWQVLTNPSVVTTLNLSPRSSRYVSSVARPSPSRAANATSLLFASIECIASISPIRDDHQSLASHDMDAVNAVDAVDADIAAIECDDFERDENARKKMTRSPTSATLSNRQKLQNQNLYNHAVFTCVQYAQNTILKWLLTHGRMRRPERSILLAIKTANTEALMLLVQHSYVSSRASTNTSQNHIKNMKNHEQPHIPQIIIEEVVLRGSRTMLSMLESIGVHIQYTDRLFVKAVRSNDPFILEHLWSINIAKNSQKLFNLNMKKQHNDRFRPHSAPSAPSAPKTNHHHHNNKNHRNKNKREEFLGGDSGSVSGASSISGYSILSGVSGVSECSASLHQQLRSHAELLHPPFEAYTTAVRYACAKSLQWLWCVSPLPKALHRSLAQHLISSHVSLDILEWMQCMMRPATMLRSILMEHAIVSHYPLVMRWILHYMRGIIPLNPSRAVMTHARSRENHVYRAADAEMSDTVWFALLSKSILYTRCDVSVIKEIVSQYHEWHGHRIHGSNSSLSSRDSTTTTTSSGLGLTFFQEKDATSDASETSETSMMFYMDIENTTASASGCSSAESSRVIMNLNNGDANDVSHIIIDEDKQRQDETHLRFPLQRQRQKQRQHHQQIISSFICKIAQSAFTCGRVTVHPSVLGWLSQYHDEAARSLMQNTAAWSLRGCDDETILWMVRNVPREVAYIRHIIEEALLYDLYTAVRAVQDLHPVLFQHVVFNCISKNRIEVAMNRGFCKTAAVIAKCPGAHLNSRIRHKLAESGV